MKMIFIFIYIVAFFSSCNLLLTNEKKTIEVCQKAKIQLQSEDQEANTFLEAFSFGLNAIWLGFANKSGMRICAVGY